MRSPLLLVLVLLSACTHWAASPQSPQAIAAPEKPGARIRVTLETGERVTVVAPVVRGEFLTGTPACAASGCVLEAPVNIRLASIRKVETRRFSFVATAGAIAGAGVVGILAAGLMASQLLPSGPF